MKPLLVSSGEPAGIGPDICLSLAGSDIPLVVMADRALLEQRCEELKLSVDLHEYQKDEPVVPCQQRLYYWQIPTAVPVESGTLDPRNATYVMSMLTKAVDACLRGEFAALVTAPVHKAVINQAGVHFTGHTEFLAERCAAPAVVMMLACRAMKVALVTTHLPLQMVSSAITQDLIVAIVKQLNQSLKDDFAIPSPRIYIAGLNPHAGEGGYLGREEIETIQPAIACLQKQGVDAQGPFPADTMFTPANLMHTDAFVAMYHDQGLPVLKYAGFGQAVNVTLGLPIIRTSVDHGTALDLAGTGLADTGSLQEAIAMANQMAANRQRG